MALVRILVDGYNLIHAISRQREFRDNQSYSLLHGWPELADACGTPVTIFFDGRGARRTKPKNTLGKSVEVLFSNAGQTADDLIERAALRFQPYGEVLVVTDDFAERDTVSGFGGSVASCGNFIAMIQNALANLTENLNNHNRSERNQFFRSR